MTLILQVYGIWAIYKPLQPLCHVFGLLNAIKMQTLRPNNSHGHYSWRATFLGCQEVPDNCSFTIFFEKYLCKSANKCASSSKTTSYIVVKDMNTKNEIW